MTVSSNLRRLCILEERNQVFDLSSCLIGKLDTGFGSSGSFFYLGLN